MLLVINSIYIDIGNDGEDKDKRVVTHNFGIVSQLPAYVFFYFRLYFINTLLHVMSGRQGGKAKPLKKPKKGQKELTEVWPSLLH